MKKVFNVPRVAAEDFGNDSPRLPEKIVWISISEPGERCTVVSNKFLDKCHKLKIAIWDLSESVEYKGKILHPPRKQDAAKIVNFLVKHTDRHVFVNCAAGVSRSGAVAQFCHDFLGYEWPDFYRRVALPNAVLYKLMVEYYQEKYLTKEEV